VQRFKARLVWGENHQIEGINYWATYLPTFQLGRVRLEFMTAIKYNLEIQQMNVCTASLGVDLEEGISLHPLQGYFHVV